MLRNFAIALAAIMTLAAAHPAEAAGSRRNEARSAGKASRATAAPVASRQAASAPRRATASTASRGSARQVVASRSTRSQARALGRREATRTTRPGVRFVSMIAGPAHAATVSGRSAKAGKASRAGGSTGRMGVWHAGLPSPDGEQMDCPVGTMAVLARGHSDTFRCMPM
jgi:hypothetical protein